MTKALILTMVRTVGAIMTSASAASMVSTTTALTSEQLPVSKMLTIIYEDTTNFSYFFQIGPWCKEWNKCALPPPFDAMAESIYESVNDYDKEKRREVRKFLHTIKRHIQDGLINCQFILDIFTLQEYRIYCHHDIA